MIKALLNVKSLPSPAKGVFYKTTKYNVQALDVPNPSQIPKEITINLEGSYSSAGRVYLRAIPKFMGVKFSNAKLMSFLQQFNDEKYNGYSSSLLMFNGPENSKAFIYVYDVDNDYVNEYESKFDEQGNLSVLLQSDEPHNFKVVTSLVPLPKQVVKVHSATINSLPFASSLRVTFWHVRVRTTNKTDVWARWQGRAIWRQPLPGLFWFPHHVGYTIGLAGYADWREIVPIIEGRTFNYQVGVSAFCNTSEPRPPHDKCCEYRKNTWWHAIIFARRKITDNWQKVGEDDINLSFHITAQFDYNSATYLGRCVSKDVACGWEQGSSC